MDWRLDMKKWIKLKQGSPAAWLMFLIGLFAIGLVYVVFTEPFSMLYDQLYPAINNTGFSTSATRVHTVWKVFPVILIVALGIWAILRTVRREPDSGFY